MQTVLQLLHHSLELFIEIQCNIIEPLDAVWLAFAVNRDLGCMHPSGGKPSTPILRPPAS